MKSPRPFSLTALLLLSAVQLRAQEAPALDTPTPPSHEDIRAFKDALRQAQGGDPEAMGNVGLMYEKGMGCAPDPAQAFHWLQRGAKKGDAASENNLGYLFLKGLGVREDDAQALAWIQKAADQGLASAQGNLGLIYGRGLGVRKDYDQSLLWFKKAAEQGDSDAQVNLAQMLSLGEGAPQDYVESYKWFTIALRDHSLTDAQVVDLRDDIEWLEKRMTGAQVNEAKKRAAEWENGPASSGGSTGPSGQATPTPQD